ncbi:MAG TPA: hypothetical protein VFI30_07460 [Nocardioidaceae bacterium]|nr:hypothetical protein [Nocardioidaceae bacterium]
MMQGRLARRKLAPRVRKAAGATREQALPLAQQAAQLTREQVVPLAVQAAQATREQVVPLAVQAAQLTREQVVPLAQHTAQTAREQAAPIVDSALTTGRQAAGRAAVRLRLVPPPKRHHRVRNLLLALGLGGLAAIGYRLWSGRESEPAWTPVADPAGGRAAPAPPPRQVRRDLDEDVPAVGEHPQPAEAADATAGAADDPGTAAAVTEDGAAGAKPQSAKDDQAGSAEESESTPSMRTDAAKASGKATRARGHRA